VDILRQTSECFNAVNTNDMKIMGTYIN